VNAEINEDSPGNVFITYYNPPIYFLELAPLVLFDIHTAYLIAISANLVLAVCMAVVIGFILRWRQPQTVLLWLALPAYAPFYTSLYHGQVTVLIACLLGGGYLAMRGGRPWLAGALFALTCVKPHWLLATFSVIKEPRVGPALVVACVVVLGLPFLLVGPGGVLDYVGLVLDRGNGDLGDSTLPAWLTSWSGFFRAFTGNSQPVLWVLASMATIVLFAVVWWRSSAAIALAASLPAALLIVPHSHPQDWVLLFASAAILLSLNWRPVPLLGIIVGLLAIFVGANDWEDARRVAAEGHFVVFWVTLGGFCLLAWLAAMALLGPERTMVTGPEEQRRLPRIVATTTTRQSA
jgi:hypothetical protein